MTSEEYDKYSYDYDRSDVIPNEVVIDENWDKCYCSSMCRAVITAKTVYHGKIIISDKLVEIPSAARIKTKFRVPYHVWAVLNRASWSENHHTNPEGKKKTRKRINEIMCEILKQTDENILIVSHAGTMFEIQRILLRNGFEGERFIKPANGRLYEFKK
jgi:broad specificity phosphatase PhoE